MGNSAAMFSRVLYLRAAKSLCHQASVYRARRQPMPPGLDTARHTDPSRIRHHRVNPELTPEVPLDTPITPSPVDDDPLYSAEELASMRWLMQEKAEAFSELSRRIARLCHRLGIQLKTEEDLRRILAREAEGFSEADRALAEFSSMGLGGTTPVANTWSARNCGVCWRCAASC